MLVSSDLHPRRDIKCIDKSSIAALVSIRDVSGNPKSISLLEFNLTIRNSSITNSRLLPPCDKPET